MYSIPVEADPVRMYLTAVQAMLDAGAVYVQHRWYRMVSEVEYPRYAERAADAQMIGWYGNDRPDGEPYAACRYWYLIQDRAFKAVAKFYQSAGVVFPDTALGIKAKLRDQKLLFPGSGRPFDYRMSATLPRVLRIVKPFVAADEG